MQHDDMDRILMNRAAAPKPRHGFAESIIHAALTQVREKRAIGFWNEMMAAFAIPHPSVALAAGVVLGLMVGIQAGDGISLLQQDWSSFLDINEGGWL